MSKVSSMTCTFCELHIESITHVFYYCIHVNVLWKTVCSILNHLQNESLVLRCQDVIFGYGFENSFKSQNMFTNDVILSVKAFVWNCRKYGTTLNLFSLSNWFKEKEAINKQFKKTFSGNTSSDLIKCSLTKCVGILNHVCILV